MRLFAGSLAFFLAVALAQASSSAKPVTLQDIDAALGARDAAQWTDFLRKIQAISERHPSQPAFRYLLAQAYAQNGDGRSAIQQLNWLSERGYSYAASTHPAFEGLRSVASFIEAAAKLDANAAVKIGRANPILTFDRNDIRPEGVAFDARHSRFLVSSVRDGSIYAVSSSGVTVAVWSETRTGHESAGVRIVPGPKDRAVFCSNSSSAIQTGSELIQLDTRTGRQTARIALPRAGTGRSYCNDIALVGGGFAVTDSESGMLWLVDRNLTKIEPLLVDGSLLYPNGIATSTDGNVIYVADMLGLNMIAVKPGRVRRVEVVDELSLAGIDGLYARKGRLIAVQNAISPERIIEIELGPDREPYSARVVAQGSVTLSDLTTAVVDGTRVFSLSGTGINRRPGDHAAFPQIVEIFPDAAN